jgi:four helix bundle protein
MDKKISGYRDLRVWQSGYELTLELYLLTKKFPKEESFGLVSQMRRAASSIPANIAEGYERNHRKEYLQFLHIAKGSLGELDTYLLLAKDLGYISAVEFDRVYAMRRETVKMLYGLIKSLS